MSWRVGETNLREAAITQFRLLFAKIGMPFVDAVLNDVCAPDLNTEYCSYWLSLFHVIVIFTLVGAMLFLVVQRLMKRLMARQARPPG